MFRVGATLYVLMISDLPRFSKRHGEKKSQYFEGKGAELWITYHMTYTKKNLFNR